MFWPVATIATQAHKKSTHHNLYKTREILFFSWALTPTHSPADAPTPPQPTPLSLSLSDNRHAPPPPGDEPHPAALHLVSAACPITVSPPLWHGGLGAAWSDAPPLSLAAQDGRQATMGLRGIGEGGNSVGHSGTGLSFSRFLVAAGEDTTCHYCVLFLRRCVIFSPPLQARFVVVELELKLAVWWAHVPVCLCHSFSFGAHFESRTVDWCCQHCRHAIAATHILSIKFET